MLQVKDLCKSYQVGRQTYPVLRGITFSIEPGEFVSVMGPSGSGKTTLLNCISCYIPFDQGEILLDGQDISKFNETDLSHLRNQKLGFVFQDFMLLDGLTVKENIMLPRILSGQTDKEMERSADRLCQVFDISHIQEKYPAEISGGEKQRTAVARALINYPLLVLADEPTGNLDSKSGRTVIESFLQAQHSLNATIFMVTHDSYAASFCDRVILLKDGVVHKHLKSGKDRKEFQKELLDSIQEMSGEGR